MVWRGLLVLLIAFDLVGASWHRHHHSLGADAAAPLHMALAPHASTDDAPASEVFHADETLRAAGAEELQSRSSESHPWDGVVALLWTLLPALLAGVWLGPAFIGSWRHRLPAPPRPYRRPFSQAPPLHA